MTAARSGPSMAAVDSLRHVRGRLSTYRRSALLPRTGTEKAGERFCSRQVRRAMGRLLCWCSNEWDGGAILDESRERIKPDYGPDSMTQMPAPASTVSARPIPVIVGMVASSSGLVFCLSLA